MKINRTQKVYSWLWALYFLQSMFFFYLWSIPGGVFGILIVLHSLFFKKQIFNSKKAISTLKLCYILILGLITYWFAYEIENVFQAINLLVLPIALLTLLRVSVDIRRYFLDLIRNIFFWFSLPSLFFYLLFCLGIDVFNLGNVTRDLYECQNHVFFLWQEFYRNRFTSLFCEPGHYAMIISFILYTQRYDFGNIKNVFLAMCLLFTLSLAGYVLSFLGFIAYRVYEGKLSIRSIMATLAILLIVIVALAQIPIIEELIFDRLEFDSESGSISGNNRINYAAASYFINISIENFLFGIGSDGMANYNIAGTGLVINIIRTGFISVMLIFLYYISLLSFYKKHFLNIAFLLLYIISFYQRSYALWAAQLLLFVCFIADNSLLKNKRFIH